MSISAVAKGVMIYLQGVSGLPPIAYPNTTFDPAGEAYLRVNILPAETTPIGIRQADRESGIIQIDDAVKDGTGTLGSLETADTIVGLFPRNMKLQADGFRIEFTRTGWSGPRQQEPGWSFVPVSIPYLLLT